MIYFIQEQSERGLIKIGLTRLEAFDRLSQLQVSCPDELKLIATMDGDEIKEDELHARFASVNYRGEWFYPVKALLDFIEKNTIIVPARKKHLSAFMQRYIAKMRHRTAIEAAQNRAIEADSDLDDYEPDYEVEAVE